jgi:hypothetical protein
MTKTIGGGAAAAILAGALALGAGPAAAGVTSCNASGGKQEVGAVIGAVLGGVIGNQVGGRHATAETVGGAALGAAAGSAIGCEAQKDRVQTSNRGPSTYSRNGYRLHSNVAAASYSRIRDTFVAESTVNLRAAPSSRASRVGRLRSGERFEALAQVRGSDWILVGQQGVGVGYVRSDLVRPAGRGYARGY